MMKKPTNAELWTRERVRGEAERMLADWEERALSLVNDREEMVDEIVRLALTKRWKRA